ncbi:membrane protein [Sphingomonas metalli]|uniref:Membrane protein n=1 Tax=Sphingomonas metalli TaxID=1779358 RepID=A0A916SUT2_9SPHN|nr:MAPEG family protein [Sphingomonas metalli]GGB16947.1 membrane protein [Sphingomonas metalli]
MMTDPAAMPVELLILGASVLLLLVHLGIQGQSATRERGVAWNAGPRDEAVPPLGRLAGRAERARDNFLETYPAFIALALALVLASRTGDVGTLGAWIWIGARVVYLPLYLLGIPYLRSLVWLVSIAGLLLMLARLFGFV